MRPGRLLIVSTTNESSSVVIPFQCLFCATLDWVLSTGDLPEWVEQKEQICSQSCFSDVLRHSGLITVLVKPLILYRLGVHDDGSIAPSTTNLGRSVTHHSS